MNFPRLFQCYQLETSNLIILSAKWSLICSVENYFLSFNGWKIERILSLPPNLKFRRRNFIFMEFLKKCGFQCYKTSSSWKDFNNYVWSKIVFEGIKNTDSVINLLQSVVRSQPLWDKVKDTLKRSFHFSCTLILFISYLEFSHS